MERHSKVGWLDKMFPQTQKTFKSLYYLTLSPITCGINKASPIIYPQSRPYVFDFSLNTMSPSLTPHS
ncbi:hypothetical protein EYC84_007183 [Monilinia fructicola]|uniref:Uncharacterized protein n=1 Tax=Monilinia fructicola TaxID=38448 RepID=A0A5M9K5T3_MONFR|nr:hypothetical protein EYC84_007183 [Monilinia fructicola]